MHGFDEPAALPWPVPRPPGIASSIAITGSCWPWRRWAGSSTRWTSSCSSWRGRRRWSTWSRAVRAEPKALDMARQVRRGDYATSIFIAGWATGGSSSECSAIASAVRRTMLIRCCCIHSSRGWFVIDRALELLVLSLLTGWEWEQKVPSASPSSPRSYRTHATVCVACCRPCPDRQRDGHGYLLGFGAAQDTGCKPVPGGHVPDQRRSGSSRTRHHASTEGAGKMAASQSRRGRHGAARIVSRVVPERGFGGTLCSGCSSVARRHRLWSVGFFTFDLIRVVRKKPMSCGLSQTARRGPRDGDKCGPHNLDGTAGRDESGQALDPVPAGPGSRKGSERGGRRAIARWSSTRPSP